MRGAVSCNRSATVFKINLTGAESRDEENARQRSTASITQSSYKHSAFPPQKEYTKEKNQLTFAITKIKIRADGIVQ